METPMSPEEFLRRVQAIIAGDGADGPEAWRKWEPWEEDAEAGHARFDGCMERLLRSLGYGAGVDAAADQRRWYA